MWNSLITYFLDYDIYETAISKLLSLYIFLDYDTHETVTCNSHFIYDLDRQRSLQHFIQIEGLPAKYKVLKLPSGKIIL